MTDIHVTISRQHIFKTKLRESLNGQKREYKCTVEFSDIGRIMDREFNIYSDRSMH